MMHQQPSTLPNPAFLATMQVGDLMKAAVRMQEILTQEHALLSEGRYRELSKFREERTQLAKTLETYQRALAVDDSLLRNADSTIRKDLARKAEELNSTAQANLKKTSLAQKVNRQVMQTITEAVSEHSRVNVYGRKGQTTGAGQVPVSINLNQKA